MNLEASSQDNRNTSLDKTGDQVDLSRLSLFKGEDLLQEHMKCKNDNLQRLQSVKSLEQLVNFKIKTVKDRLVENSSEQGAG